LWSDGMFMDGLWYATIARNMSEGIGSFWRPQLSETIYVSFYEHPALAFWLHGGWYSLLGDHIWVERLYSLTMHGLTAALIALIWRAVTGNFRLAWLAIFIWLCMPKVSWACANNMLENTLMVFTTASVLALWLALSKHKLWLTALAGLLLTLALGSKGLVALYIWAMPMVYWLTQRSTSFLQASLHTLVLVASTLLPVALLYYLNADAAHSIRTYLETQVAFSIESVQTVNSRFAIIGYFFEQVIVPLLLIALLWLFTRKSGHMISQEPKERRWTATFWILCLAGILPIMVSLKQRPFYILSVYPLFALGLGLLVRERTSELIDSISTRAHDNIRRVAYVLAVIAVSLSIWSTQQIGRDHVMIRDCHRVVEAVGSDTHINMDFDMRYQFNRYGYYMRHGHVSLCAFEPCASPYYLLDAAHEHSALADSLDLQLYLQLEDGGLYRLP